MTNEKLLLVDLCARLPYRVRLFTNSKNHIRLLTISHDIDYDEQVWVNGLYDVDEVKPYLRSMSSMTLEELEEYRRFDDHIRDAECKIHIANYNQIDWLNRNHFDYRGLIPKGLAIAVTEENNPYKD